jgi:hypothetical protein
MAKAILPAGYNNPGIDQPLEIELKEPWIAALLAWLLPGAGHVYQGRTGKGLLFFICVMGTFVFGLIIGDWKVVYASSPGEDPWRWQYYCQLGVGAAAMPALLQREPVATRREDGGFMAPPSHEPVRIKDSFGNWTTQPNELAAWTVEMHPNYEIGTVYTVIAGLLNVLVICDAYGGPLVLTPKKKGKEGESPDGGEVTTQ